MGSAGGSVLILCSFLFYVLLAVLVLRFCFGSRSSRCRPVSFEKIQRNSHFHAPSLCDTPTRSSPTRRTDQSNSFRQTQSQATNKTNEVRGYPPPPKPPPARFDFEFLLADRLTWVLEPQPLPTEYDLVHNNQIGWTIPTDGACSRPLLPTQPETQCLTLSLSSYWLPRYVTLDLWINDDLHTTRRYLFLHLLFFVKCWSLHARFF